VLALALEDPMTDPPVVLLLSGPNLNLLGEREPEIYGSPPSTTIVARHRAGPAHGLELEHLQSNHEGELVDAIHAARGAGARPSSSTPAPSPTTPGRSTTPSPPSTARRRAAPVEPRRPRAVAAHLGGGARRDGNDRRLRPSSGTTSPIDAVA
jgi:hypothetical protein